MEGQEINGCYDILVTAITRLSASISYSIVTTIQDTTNITWNQCLLLLIKGSSRSVTSNNALKLVRELLQFDTWNLEYLYVTLLSLLPWLVFPHPSDDVINEKISVMKYLYKVIKSKIVTNVTAKEVLPLIDSLLTAIDKYTTNAKQNGIIQDLLVAFYQLFFPSYSYCTYRYLLCILQQEQSLDSDLFFSALLLLQQFVSREHHFSLDKSSIFYQFFVLLKSCMNQSDHTKITSVVIEEIVAKSNNNNVNVMENSYIHPDSTHFSQNFEQFIMISFIN